MRLGKEIKRDTQLIIISVLVLTLLTMNVSYSAFFSVKSQTTVQKITTGNLNVLIDGSTGMSNKELYPTPEEDLPIAVDSVTEGNYATLNLSNTGDLVADFSITLSYDEIPAGETEDNLISFKYLNIGIFDVNENAWKNFGTDTNEIYYTRVTGLTPSDTNVYPILRDQLAIGANKQYRVYVWLAEDTPISEIGRLVYLKLDVKSTTINGGIESQEG
ncbi:MAG: hypothetical protein E7161_00450 [Firmicutes bacterium]|nr:hypothetical protein [Bacillota bacterium]